MIVPLGKICLILVLIVNSSAAFIYDASRNIEGKSIDQAGTDH